MTKRSKKKKNKREEEEKKKRKEMEDIRSFQDKVICQQHTKDIYILRSSEVWSCACGSMSRA